jgi:sugar (pentulose or hexulose) kinase
MTLFTNRGEKSVAIYIGIDMGTSACRASAIDDKTTLLAETRTELPSPQQTDEGIQQEPAIWWDALTTTLDTLFAQIDTSQVRRLLVDGTSSTLLLCTPGGRPLTDGLMYNDTRATAAAATIQQEAPTDSAAQGAGSSLAKLMYLRDRIGTDNYLARHQADWLTGKLCGDYRYSDANNVLKLGYNTQQARWPTWLEKLELDSKTLPEVVPPGKPIGTLENALTSRWHCPSGVEVAAGTTDSTAGFIAAGADATGSAVTALGSTLVIKVLSDTPVFSASHGVYSHALGGRWLVGGASNAGGAVLRELFSDAEIQQLTDRIDPTRLTGLDYYPLSRPGERFPVQDPGLQPRLEPRPDSDAEFFQGLLEGLARIEQQGYRLLESLGAPYPEHVITVGGGACNSGWQTLRAGLLGVPVSAAKHQEAAYGAALLALRGESVFTDP